MISNRETCSRNGQKHLAGKPRLRIRACAALTVLLGAWAGLVSAAGKDDDVEKVRTRLLNELIPSDPTEPRAAQLVSQARKWKDKLAPDGTWPDINYASRRKAHWPVADHVRRLSVMARAYRCPGHPLTQSPQLRRAILRGLDHWLARDYTAPSWFANQLAVPGGLGQVALAMEDEIGPERKETIVRMLRERSSLDGRQSIRQGCCHLFRVCKTPFFLHFMTSDYRCFFRFVTAEFMQAA